MKNILLIIRKSILLSTLVVTLYNCDTKKTNSKSNTNIKSEITGAPPFPSENYSEPNQDKQYNILSGKERVYNNDKNEVNTSINDNTKRNTNSNGLDYNYTEKQRRELLVKQEKEKIRKEKKLIQKQKREKSRLETHLQNNKASKEEIQIAKKELKERQEKDLNEERRKIERQQQEERKQKLTEINNENTERNNVENQNVTNLQTVIKNHQQEQSNNETKNSITPEKTNNAEHQEEQEIIKEQQNIKEEEEQEIIKEQQNRKEEEEQEIIKEQRNRKEQEIIIKEQEIENQKENLQDIIENGEGFYDVRQLANIFNENYHSSLEKEYALALERLFKDSKDKNIQSQYIKRLLTETSNSLLGSSNYEAMYCIFKQRPLEVSPFILTEANYQNEEIRELIDKTKTYIKENINYDYYLLSSFSISDEFEEMLVFLNNNNEYDLINSIYNNRKEDNGQNNLIVLLIGMCKEPYFDSTYKKLLNIQLLNMIFKDDINNTTLIKCVLNYNKIDLLRKLLDNNKNIHDENKDEIRKKINELRSVEMTKSHYNNRYNKGPYVTLLDNILNKLK